MQPTDQMSIALVYCLKVTGDRVVSLTDMEKPRKKLTHDLGRTIPSSRDVFSHKVGFCFRSDNVIADHTVRSPTFLGSVDRACQTKITDYER